MEITKELTKIKFPKLIWFSNHTCSDINNCTFSAISGTIARQKHQALNDM